MSVRQQLFLSVIDKLVIGLLVVAAGFMANSILDGHKADSALKTELAKVRSAKIEAVWTSVDGALNPTLSLQHDLAGYLLVSNGYRLDVSPEFRKSAVSAESDRVIKMHDAIDDLLERDRFWLGEKLYRQFRRYFAAEKKQIDVVAQIVKTDEPANLKSLERQVKNGPAELQAIRLSVIQSVEKIIRT